MATRASQRDPATPSLAGQDAQYLAARPQAYKAGSRKDETMKGIAASLDDKTMKNLAAFYAAQQPQAPKVRKPLDAPGADRSLRPLPRRQRQQHRSARCPRSPRSARTGSRQSSRLPHRRAQEHRDGGHDLGTDRRRVKDLAGYYSRQTARAVTFIPLPAK